MQKKHYGLLLLFLWLTQMQAIDLNSTTEIINQATEKTEQISHDMDAIIESSPTTPMEIVISEPKLIIEPTSIEHIEENNQTKRVSTVEPITPLLSVDTPIVEDSSPIQIETNQTTIEEIVEQPIATEEAETMPIIDSNLTVIEAEPIPLIESNQTMIETLTETIEIESVAIEENNQTIIEVVAPIMEETPAIPLPVVESQPILLIENNVTTITEGNSSKESNTTLNKETFDMSKGDTDEGKKIYIAHIKESCNLKASKFAENYEQEEWEGIAEEGKFEATIFEICPTIKESYINEWSPDLYQFFYENASDSEHIPEC